MDINKLCPGCMGTFTEGEKCPICGYAGEENDKNYLPVKYILSGRYIIGKVLSANCESVVYLAYDNNEERPVNIKEFFPDKTAFRGAEGEIVTGNNGLDVFKPAFNAFWRLNKSLMLLDLPSLAKVYSVFEENGTAYAVYESLVGITLKEFLKKNNGKLKWEQARPLFLPLIDTVIGLNKAGIIHGGISPESILVCRDGRVRLGEILINGVRRSNKKMTAQIYSGYAALEQYSPEQYSMGEFTDVYALSATLYRVLTGSVPQESASREKADNLTIPSGLANELPRQVLSAMANGLQVRSENRTANMEQFRDELVYGETADTVAPQPQPQHVQKQEISSKAKPQVAKNSPAEDKKEDKKSSVKVWLITLVITVVILGVLGALLKFGPLKEYLPGNSSKSSESQEIDNSSKEEKSTKPEVTYPAPDFLGKSFEQAQETAQNDRSNCTVVLDKKIYSDIYEAGTVCEQSVNPYEDIEAGTEIKLAVSLGKREVQMPSLIGKSKSEALIELWSRGISFTNIKISDGNKSDEAYEAIIGQSPSAGETVDVEKTEITITWNKYKSSNDDEDEESAD